MMLLEKIKNVIKPSPGVKLSRARDRLKPFKGRYDDAGIFTYNDAGFTVELKDGVHTIQWDKLEKLTAYKIDLMAYDEICLNVIHENGSFTITEDTPGWHLFIEKIKTIFP